jgi:hypothetical protein
VDGGGIRCDEHFMPTAGGVGATVFFNQDPTQGGVTFDVGALRPGGGGPGEPDSQPNGTRPATEAPGGGTAGLNLGWFALASLAAAWASHRRWRRP